jgi:dihydrofolate synthase/folylpolyglutamate synthase
MINEARATPLSAGPARQAAVDWLLGRINYERTAEIPYSERQLKLDRMRQLLVRLGQPDAGMKIVHVAGTKGKGSTSAMIAGMLTSAGFRTGLFTSPHLTRIEERFAVDGQPCTAQELVALVDRVRPIVAAMDGEQGVRCQVSGVRGAELPSADAPTFFEIVTAISLVHFVERHVDAAVLEVGLGGRLDSTNVCLPAVSVITSISFDHTRQLGNTLAAIAREKAGIIKPGVPVVSGVTAPEPRAAIAEVAREHGCRMMELGRDFGFEYEGGDFGFRIADCGLAETQSAIRNPGYPLGAAIDAVPLAMRGRHQAQNAAVALAAVLELRQQGWCISTAAMRDGLSRTVVPARVELLEFPSTRFPGRGFSVVLDVAHNPASAQALVDALAEMPMPLRRTLILSISGDKDARAIAATLVPHFDRVLVTQYQENPRAIAAEELAAIVRESWEEAGVRHGESSIGCRVSGVRGRGVSPPDVIVHRLPADAWAHAQQTAAPDELICITGSFFLAAEMRPYVVGTGAPDGRVGVP